MKRFSCIKHGYFLDYPVIYGKIEGDSSSCTGTIFGDFNNQAHLKKGYFI